jgi:hypothetical protein
MTDRAALIASYRQKHKDLAAIQEQNKTKLLEKAGARDEFEKTEKYLKNLECIAQLVGEVL